MCLASVAFPLAIQMHRRDAFIFNVHLKQSTKRNGQQSIFSLFLSLSRSVSYRNFKLRHFATRFITSINYFGRKGWQGEFQTSGFPYVRRKVRRVQLSRISRFHPPLVVALFRSLISFVSPVPPVSSSCYLSYSVIPSLPINVLLLIPRGKTIYTVFFTTLHP